MNNFRKVTIVGTRSDDLNFGNIVIRKASDATDNRFYTCSVFSETAPTALWHIFSGYRHPSFSVAYRITTREQFLYQLNELYPNDFTWILWNPEILEGKYYGK